MVGDKNKTTRQDNNSVELEASLAPAEAVVGDVAKADQHANGLYVTHKVEPKLSESRMSVICLGFLVKFGSSWLLIIWDEMIGGKHEQIG